MLLEDGIMTSIVFLYAYAIIVRLIKGFKNPIFLGIILINGAAVTISAFSAISKYEQPQTGTSVCLAIGFFSFVYLISVIRTWDVDSNSIAKDMQGEDCQSSKGKNALIMGFVNGLSIISLFTYN